MEFDQVFQVNSGMLTACMVALQYCFSVLLFYVNILKLYTLSNSEEN